MPNKHANRYRNKVVNMLITQDQVKSGRIWYAGDRENIVNRMDQSAKDEAIRVIRDRYDTAKDQTYLMREKMNGWDMQYKGQWQDGEDDGERIFLPKTREEINAVRAFIISMLSELRPIVTMRPGGAGVIYSTIQEDFKRAKLNEALFDYYFSDVWHALDDIIPRWLTHFLKYSLACLKVTYYETEHSSDLKIDVVDRAFLYIDPRANRTEDSGWIMEEYYIPRSEVNRRVEIGDWVVADIDMERLSGINTGNLSISNLQRFFGHNTDITTLNEDEFIRCVDYWQFPKDGLGDLYATIIGGSDDSVDGILARYGKNPFPYKGNPYITESFNPDDRPDGQGMAELQEPFQKVVNTFLNLRLDDVRKNIRKTNFVLEQMIDAQTLQDIKEGNSIARLSKEFGENLMRDPTLKIDNFMGQLPYGTSTGELLSSDLPFILAQGQESANLPDVFRGMSPNPGATLGQVQEQITRAAGQFRPILRRVMRTWEKVAEIATSYFKSDEFFSSERIIRVVGKGIYDDLINNGDWHKVSPDTAYKSVTADELLTDLTFDAVNGADALVSKTLIRNNAEFILNGLGQIPEMRQMMADEISFTRLFMQIINASGIDTDTILLTKTEKDQKAMQQQQQMQQAMEAQQQQQQQAIQLQQAMAQMQAQIDMMKEEQKQGLMAQKQIAVDNNRTQAQMTAESARISQETESQLKLLIEKTIRETLGKTDVEMVKGYIQEDLMYKEAELERKAAKSGESISVGEKGNNIQTPGV